MCIRTETEEAGRDDWTSPGVHIPLNEYKQTNEYRRSLLMDCIQSSLSPPGTHPLTLTAPTQRKNKHVSR